MGNFACCSGRNDCFFQTLSGRTLSGGCSGRISGGTAHKYSGMQADAENIFTSEKLTDSEENFQGEIQKNMQKSAEKYSNVKCKG